LARCQLQCGPKINDFDAFSISPRTDNVFRLKALMHV
jgi:hypothetical protein